MTRTGTIWTLTAALACASLATPARAQQITETRIRELIQQAAERTAIGVAVDPQQPASAAPAANRPVVHLTLDDAVKLALDRNLDIAVQRLNPEISDVAIASARAVYNPVLTSSFGPQSVTQLPTSQLQLGAGGAATVTDTLNYNGGVSQSIPWGGGSFSAGLNNFRRTSNSNNSLFNPQFQSAWSFAYTQPVLRNFGVDATRRTIQVTRLNRDISDVQLRSTITNTVSNVRNAYWDYVFAVQSVDVAQRSLDLAEQLVKDNQTRVEVGTMAPIDVVQAQSQSATQRQNLVVAQGTMRTAELALKRLIVSGTADANWNVQIDPTDRPDFRPEAIDVEAAVRRALSERTDVAIAKKNIEANDDTLKYLRDQLKPQADLALSYIPQGVGGTELFRSSSGTLGSTITSTQDLGMSEAFASLFRNTYPQWTAQVNFSYPLGVSTQRANVARARIQLNQVEAQMKQIELQVATDVTNAAINVQSGIERVQAAQSARELAQKTLEAEQSKFEVGMSTNYNVILTQRDLATAQNNELQAILNYRKALVEFERLQQTTLQSLGISILSPQ